MGTFSNIASIFSDIANSLRSKMGSQDTFTPSQMAGAVNNIPTGAQVDEYKYIGLGDTNNGVHAYTDTGRNADIPIIQYNDASIIKEDSSISNAQNYFNSGANLEQGVIYRNDSTFIFGNNIKNMYYCFNNCKAIVNPNIYIGSNVNSMFSCFFNCSNMTNPNIQIATDILTSMGYCFYNCRNFNAPIDLNGSYLVDIQGCFSFCFLFNQPVTIGPNVSYMDTCFWKCQNFNAPIVFTGDRVRNMYQCFNDCFKFNQPVYIGNNATEISYCFYNCFEFNQPVHIGDAVRDMIACFGSCIKFNQPVHIGDKVQNMTRTFENCLEFNQSIHFGNNVKSLYNCFGNCTNFENDLFFNNSSNITNSKRLFSRCNKQKVKRIFCNNATPFIIVTNYDSIAGDMVTWTPMSDGNGYYNAYCNIYIYNNWTPS